MKTETKEVHTCDHCRKYMLGKGAMARHENNCKNNPANIDACLDCTFMVVSEVEIVAESEDYGDPDYRKKCKSFTCSKMKQIMYPFAAVKKKLPTLYPETFKGQVRMPTACEHFKYKYAYSADDTQGLLTDWFS